MALLEFHVHEVDARATATFSLFGGRKGAPDDRDTEADSGTGASISVSKPESSPNLLGLVLFLLGIGLAVWLGRRR